MYLRPRTLDEAVSALAEGGGILVAGGTDVYPALVDRPPPERVIDLTAVAGMRSIERAADGYRIGAGVTWTGLLRTPLPAAFDGLKAAAREVGSVQIQNRATIAGNICNASPAADGAPALLALDAELELTGAAGTRRLALSDFLLGNRSTARRPDEILSAILVPEPLPRTGSAFVKLGARRYLVISIVMVAATVSIDARGAVAAARVAVGSAAATARRLPALESAVAGTPAGRSLANLVTPSHLAPLSPIDDVRASAAYRLDAALDLVGRALEDARASAEATDAG
jgi:CO/xanthine dehydrogenase FAD-binding subunit